MLFRSLAADGRRKRLVATQPAGPEARIQRCPDGAAELALVADGIRSLLAAGTPSTEVAVLVRTNAQLPPLEEALTRAAIPFQLQGRGFFGRREVREGLRLLHRLGADGAGGDLATSFESRLGSELGLRPADEAATGGGAEARERDAALRLLAQLVADASREIGRAHV